MPPNAHQDAHGSNAGGLAVTTTSPPAAASNSKMDCFLTTACTPLNLQVRAAVLICAVVCRVA